MGSARDLLQRLSLVGWNSIYLPIYTTDVLRYMQAWRDRFWNYGVL